MIHRNTRALAACLTIALCLPTSASAAQPPAPAADLKEASLHFRRGATLFDEQDYAGALVEFNRANKIAPSAEVSFNIGQCHFQLANYIEAHDALSGYLRSGSVPADRLALVNRELSELRERIGNISVQCDTPGCQVRIDDVQVKLGSSVAVNVGRRRVVASAEGYKSEPRVVEVAGRENVSQSFTLVAEKLVATPMAKAAAEDTGIRPEVYVAFGLAGAGLAVGGVFGALALSSKSTLDGACSNNVCPRSMQDTHDELTRNATISTIGFVVGASVAAIGLALYLWPKSKQVNASIYPGAIRLNF
jgi:hypothetical protein